MFRRCKAATLVIAILAAAAIAQAGTRGITELDLFKFIWIGDARVSPDGRQVAFVRVTVNEKQDAYDTAIWIVPVDGSGSPRLPAMPVRCGRVRIQTRWRSCGSGPQGSSRRASPNSPRNTTSRWRA